MKKIYSAIAGGLLMFGMAGSAQAFDVAFNGFCDGVSINTGDDLSLSGTYTGCRASVVSGNVNIALAPTAGLAATVSPNETTEAGPGWVYVIDFNAARTWRLYMGGVFFQDGTWSPGLPGAAAADSGATGE